MNNEPLFPIANQMLMNKPSYPPKSKFFTKAKNFVSIPPLEFFIHIGSEVTKCFMVADFWQSDMCHMPARGEEAFIVCWKTLEDFRHGEMTTKTLLGLSASGNTLISNQSDASKFVVCFIFSHLLSLTIISIKSSETSKQNWISEYMLRI